MALKKRHEAFGTIRQIVTDRLYLQWLPITDPDAFGEALDEAARDQWKANEALIPIDSGDLRKILTANKSANREIQARSGRVVLVIKHNGMAYRASVRDAVMAALDVRKLVREAVDTLRRKAPRQNLRRGGRRR